MALMTTRSSSAGSRPVLARERQRRLGMAILVIIHLVYRNEVPVHSTIHAYLLVDHKIAPMQSQRLDDMRRKHRGVRRDGGRHLVHVDRLGECDV